MNFSCDYQFLSHDFFHSHVRFSLGPIFTRFSMVMALLLQQLSITFDWCLTKGMFFIAWSCLKLPEAATSLNFFRIDIHVLSCHKNTASPASFEISFPPVTTLASLLSAYTIKVKMRSFNAPVFPTPREVERVVTVLLPILVLLLLTAIKTSAMPHYKACSMNV